MTRCAIAGDETNRAVATLLDAGLSEEQQTLLKAILWPVVDEGRADDALWPTWQYLRRGLGRDGIDAQQVFDSLPTLQGPQRSYGLVWRDMPGAGVAVRPDEKVGLTLAGLHRADPHADHERADRLAQLVALLAHGEARLPLDPTGVVTETIQLADIAAPYLTPSPRAGATSMTLRAAVHLLGREPIPILVNFDRFTTVIGDSHLMPFRDVTTAQDYLAALIRHADLHAPSPARGDARGGSISYTPDGHAHETTRRNPTIDEWPARSRDAREIADAQVLAGLLAGLGEDGQTASSTAQVVEQLVEQLGITGVDPDHLAVRLVQLGYFREDSLSLEPGSDTLLVTAQGRRAASEFAAARRKIKVAPAARSAILRWLYEIDAVPLRNLPHFLGHPRSWFYGTQFTLDQATNAARSLRDRGFIRAYPSIGGDLLGLKLTPRGVRCVERYDADPDALEHIDAAPRTDDAMTSTPATHGSAASSNETPTVFLVHGHDETFKFEVAHYIGQMLDQRVRVVILHDEPNAGQTVTEKFEGHARRASYAVVLLTPDDRGGPSGGDQQDRSRQNVVFELGYFCGCLGRDRVAAINKGVEIPSDFDGVAYIPYPGQWRDDLRNEFRAAGLPLRP